MASVKYTYHDFINDLVNCHSRAERMRSPAESTPDEVREIYAPAGEDVPGMRRDDGRISPQVRAH